MPANDDELHHGRAVRIDATNRTGTITEARETCPQQFQVTLDGESQPLDKIFHARDLTVVGES
jgi:hypothetical protein